MNYRVVYSNELYHHGIKGQQWGVRNGPPYPLGESDKSSSEKKEKTKKSLQLTDKQKKMLKIGAAVAVTGIAAYGLYKTGALNSINNFATGGIVPKELIDQSTKMAENAGIDKIEVDKWSNSDDMLLINAGLDLPDEAISAVEKGKISSLSPELQIEVVAQYHEGNLLNCKFDTAAAACRRQGWDVIAGTSHAPKDANKVFDWWLGNPVVETMDGFKMTSKEQITDYTASIYGRGIKNLDPVKEIKHLQSRLSSYGDGAYGDLMVSSGQFGHSVEFFVDGNQIRVYDKQIGKSYNSLIDFFVETEQYNPSFSQFCRLDTLTPNFDNMIKDGVIKRR